MPRPPKDSTPIRPLDAPAPAAPAPDAPPVDAPRGTVFPELGTPLVFVPCTVPGFEHIAVGFNLDTIFEQMLDIQDSDLLKDPARLLRTIAHVAREFQGWNLQEPDETPIPAPTPTDLRTYRVLLRRLDLAVWCAVEGYTAALGMGSSPKLPSA